MERGGRGVSSSLTEVRSEASLLKIHLVKTVSMGRKKVGGSPSWVSRAVPLLGCGVDALTASAPLSLLRTLLGRLGKSDERREERDQSGQVFHDQSAIPGLLLGQPSTGAFDLIHVHRGPGFKDKGVPSVDGDGLNMGDHFLANVFRNTRNFTRCECEAYDWLLSALSKQMAD